MIHYDTLLQNATDIITKCDKNLLKNVSGFLLQNAAVLLQFTTVNIKCLDFITNAAVITNSKVYCKMRWGTTFKKKKSELLEEMHYKVKGSK